MTSVLDVVRRPLLGRPRGPAHPHRPVYRCLLSETINYLANLARTPGGQPGGGEQRNRRWCLVRGLNPRCSLQVPRSRSNALMGGRGPDGADGNLEDGAA
jgi:hypothetical protein